MPKGELFAALIAIALGAPLLFFFSRAIADGVTRQEQTPIRAVIGNDDFNKLAAGEKTPLNYMGDDRLAPDFTLRDKNGHPWHLRDHRGHVVVLNFWTVTCGPCVQEMPTLVELSRVAEDQWHDVDVVAVSVDKGWSSVSTLFPQNMPLTVLFDPDRSIVNGKYGTQLFPETWVIDPKGIIRLRVDGGRDWSDALSTEVIDSFR